MHIGIGSHRVLGITQVPDVDAWVAVVVIGDSELGRDLWVPGHLEVALLRCWCLSSLAEEIIADRCTRRLSEVEDRSVNLEVPNDNLAVLTTTSQDVRHDPVPCQ